MEGIEALLTAAEMLQSHNSPTIDIPHYNGIDLLLKASYDMESCEETSKKSSEVTLETSDSGVFSHENCSPMESDIENKSPPVKRNKRLVKRRLKTAKGPKSFRKRTVSSTDDDDVNENFEQFAADYLRFDESEVNMELMIYNPKMVRNVSVSDKSHFGKERRMKNISACRISRAKSKVLLKKRLFLYSTLSDDNSVLSDSWSNIINNVPRILNSSSESYINSSSLDYKIDCTILKYVL